MWHHLQRNWRDMLSSKSGNVAVIFALAALPMLFAVGMGIDYTGAAERRDQLNAIADAAALSTVTPSMMSQSSSAAQTAAVNMFNAQAASVYRTQLNASAPTIKVKDTLTPAGVTRNTTVTYGATSANFFPTVLGNPAIAISGTASAQNSTLPNMNFYMMLDTSPSMALPATSDGINAMYNLTGGCAFACHQSGPTGNPGNVDNYTIARNNNIPLRIDRVQSAVQSMISSAQNTEASNSVTYGMAIFDFDAGLTPVAWPMSTNLTQVQQQTSGIQMLQVYKDQWITSTNNNQNIDSAWEIAMSGMNSKMATPGNGTNKPNDSPQEVLFIVTDGVAHEWLNGASIVQSMGDVNSSNWCSTIQGRGIQIAILYITYDYIPNSPVYNQKVQPWQPQSTQYSIPYYLKNCATNGLFFQVDTDGDITAAMNALFQAATGLAHLTH